MGARTLSHDEGAKEEESRTKFELEKAERERERRKGGARGASSIFIARPKSRERQSRALLIEARRQPDGAFSAPATLPMIGAPSARSPALAFYYATPAPGELWPPNRPPSI